MTYAPATSAIFRAASLVVVLVAIIACAVAVSRCAAGARTAERCGR